MTIKNEVEFFKELYLENNIYSMEMKKLGIPVHTCSKICFTSSENDFAIWNEYEKIIDNSINYSVKLLNKHLFISDEYNFYFFISDSNFFHENRISNYFKIYKELKKNFPDITDKISNYNLLREDVYREEFTKKIRYYSLEKIDKNYLREFIYLCNNQLNSSVLLISKNNYSNSEDKLRFFKSAYPIDGKTKLPCEDGIKLTSIIHDYCLNGDYILKPSISHVDEMAFSVQLFMSNENFHICKSNIEKINIE